MMRLLLSAILLLVAPAAARAGGPPGSGDDVRWRLEATGEHTFEQDLDGPGDVALSRSGLEGSLSAPLADGLRAGLFAGYEWARYDFDGATGLAPGRSDPWDDLHQATLGASLDVEGSERWSFFARLGATWAGETDASLGGGLTYQGFGGARWRFRDDLAFTLGLLGLSRLEDDPIVVPILGIDWRITDRLRFYTPGPGLALAATLADHWELAVSAGWETRDYRLDGGRPGLPDGVVRDDRVPLALELAYRRGPARLALRAGATLYQEFEIDDRTGDGISRVETDPAPFLGIRGGLRF
jgi:hypothetical protein